MTDRFRAPNGVARLLAPFAFPPAKRLRKGAEFGRVFAEPLRSADRYFTVLARANAQHNARLGLTISRRAAKRAVDRNRLKRLAREMFRLQPALPACDFVVMAKSPAAAASAAELRRSLRHHFEQLASKAAASAAHG